MHSSLTHYTQTRPLSLTGYQTTSQRPPIPYIQRHKTSQDQDDRSKTVTLQSITTIHHHDHHNIQDHHNARQYRHRCHHHRALHPISTDRLRNLLGTNESRRRWWERRINDKWRRCMIDSIVSKERQGRREQRQRHCHDRHECTAGHNHDRKA